jgi:hypothetical protein
MKKRTVDLFSLGPVTGARVHIRCIEHHIEHMFEPVASALFLGIAGVCRETV